MQKYWPNNSVISVLFKYYYNVKIKANSKYYRIFWIVFYFYIFTFSDFIVLLSLQFF